MFENSDLDTIFWSPSWKYTPLLWNLRDNKDRGREGGREGGRDECKSMWVHYAVVASDSAIFVYLLVR